MRITIMSEKILIVDDEEEILSLLKDSLEDEGYEIITATNGNDAIRKIKLQPDLIILDIMLPGINGFDICHAIRDIISCPILFLSSKQSEMDRIKGLSIGGDDYIVKPFSLKELKARIAAHIRRDHRAKAPLSRHNLRYGNIFIDLSAREIYYKEQIISFTKKEFDIIELLALNIGQVFTKEQIYEKIWGYDAEGNSTSVVEHIKNIRSKLELYENTSEYICTIWGVGYKWQKSIY
jgi:two-component system, OmpR family, lantibiotic biosynthesis response regulator NisR/SpaR